MRTVGIGDGVCAPEESADAPEGEPAAELTVEDRLLLSKVGGTEALLTQVEWFRGAIGDAPSRVA